MCTLAHVFEAAGLSTIVLASMVEVARRMNPPRVLACEFPLGRPLGKPLDAGFQRDVLARGFALLDETEPTLVEHPEVIAEATEAMSCSLPPQFDPDLPPAVDEARGLRAAYDRAVAANGGVTAVGRVIDADTVPDALDALHRWATGTPWTEHELPGRNTIAVMHDIRSYYREAALELVDGPVPDGRAEEEWFFSQTQAGATAMAARTALKEQDAPHPFWFYMAPGHR